MRILRYPLRAATGGPLGYVREYARRPVAHAAAGARASAARPVDVVHACNPPDLLFLVGARAARPSATRFVFDQHDLVPELFESRFDRGEAPAVLVAAACSSG